MTLSRRTSRRPRRIAAVALLALSAGCANAPKLASGRLPYDGGSEQDPFRSQTAPSFERTASSDRPDRAASTASGSGATTSTAAGQAGPQPTFGPQEFAQAPPAAPTHPFASTASSAPPAAVPYQAAYRQPEANPFGEVTAPAGVPADPFAPSGGQSAPVTTAAYQSPAENPFAELNSAPVAAADPMPVITPAGTTAPAGDPWQSQSQVTASAPAEEFLPPVRQ